MSMVGVKAYKIGDFVKVHHCHGGYRLPDGLPEGASVRVVAFDPGYRNVEYQGQSYRVSMACIDSGLEECPSLNRGLRGGNME